MLKSILFRPCSYSFLDSLASSLLKLLKTAPDFEFKMENLLLVKPVCLLKSRSAWTVEIEELTLTALRTLSLAVAGCLKGLGKGALVVALKP